MNLRYATNDGAFYLWNDNDKNFSEYLCREVKVEAVVIDIVTKLQSLMLSFESRGNIVRDVVPRVWCTQNQLLKFLVERGLDIVEADGIYLKKIIMEKEQEAKTIFTHERLGFIEQEAGAYFLETSIGAKQESHYNGKLDLYAKGNCEKWFQLVKEEACGNIPLEIALAIGFSAPVMSRLNDYSNTETLMASLVGRTSTGKTTALTLMASIWGRPDFSKEGLLSSFNSTITAQMKQLSNKSGFPVFIDESTSLGNSRDWSRYIYDISNGLEKERCDSNANLKDRLNWLTTIVITSEQSMLKDVDNGGVQVRLLEFPLQFFTSAESADRVKSTVKRTYGHAGSWFVNNLMSISDEELHEQYDKAVRVLTNRLSNKLGERIRVVRKLAIFLVTANILNRAGIGIKMHMKAHIRELAAIEAEAYQKRDNVSEEAYEYLKNKILENFSKLHVGKDRDIVSSSQIYHGSTIGRLIANCRGEIEYIWLLSSAVKSFLNDSRYLSKKDEIFDNWIDRGWLVMTEKSTGRGKPRHDCTRKIFGISQRVQIFAIASDEFKEKLKIKQKEPTKSLQELFAEEDKSEIKEKQL